jgi:hypothetical protein
MKFAQIIEFETRRLDEFNANLDAWMATATVSRTGLSCEPIATPTILTC